MCNALAVAAFLRRLGDVVNCSVVARNAILTGSASWAVAASMPQMILPTSRTPGGRFYALLQPPGTHSARANPRARQDSNL
jgi:hypothetical protein